MAQAVILLNAMLYLAVVAILGDNIYGFMFRHALPAEFSEMLSYVVLIRLLVIVPTLVCLFGLLRQTRWGYRLAFSWNLSLAFLLGGLPILGAAYGAYLSGLSFSFLLPRGAQLAFMLVSAILFCAMAIALKSSPVRHHFQSRASRLSPADRRGCTCLKQGSPTGGGRRVSGR